MIGDIFKDYHILEITRKDAFEAMNQHQDDEKIIKLLSVILGTGILIIVSII